MRNLVLIHVSKQGLIVGGEISYDVSQAKLSKWSYAGGYIASDYAITLKGINKCNGLEASYYQRVNSDTEVAVKALGNVKTVSDVSIEVGAKYALDADAFVKVKTNSLGHLGLGYTQVLRPGVKLSLGGLFDTTRLNENAHKIGLSLALEA